MTDDTQKIKQDEHGHLVKKGGYVVAPPFPGERRKNAISWGTAVPETISITKALQYIVKPASKKK
jgi:hypothetical protein